MMVARKANSRGVVLVGYGPTRRPTAGEVVFVQSFEELDALPVEKVKGKIVVFDPGWHGYGINSSYRGTGLHVPQRRALWQRLCFRQRASRNSSHTRVQRAITRGIRRFLPPRFRSKMLR